MASKTKKKQYALVPKPGQHALKMKTFIGKSGQSYLVMKSPERKFRVFVEIATKKAAEDCGCSKPRRGTSPDQMWEEVWERQK